MANNNEQNFKSLSALLEDILQETNDNIVENVRDSLTGKSVYNQAKAWGGTFKDRDKYSTTGKTKEQQEALLAAASTQDGLTGIEQLQRFIKGLEEEGATLVGRFKQVDKEIEGIELQMVPLRDKNFLNSEKAKQLRLNESSFIIPVDKNGRITYDGLERANITYPIATKNGEVGLKQATTVGLDRMMEQFKYKKNRDVIHAAMKPGATDKEIAEGYKRFNWVTTKQMRSAILPGSAMSQYNPKIMEELQESFRIQGSPYREETISSTLYLDHMFDEILNSHIHADNWEERDKTRNKYLQQISKMSLIVRTQGIERGLEQIKANPDFNDILTSSMGKPIMTAISEFSQLGTIMGPVSDSNGLQETFALGINRAFDFFFPPDSRKGMQTELNRQDYIKKSSEFSRTKGAAFMSAWEAETLSDEERNFKAYDTTRLLPVTQAQLKEAIEKKRAALGKKKNENPDDKDAKKALRNAKRDNLLSVSTDAMILSREAAGERLGYETVTKKVQNELIAKKYNELSEKNKRLKDNKKTDEELAKLAIQEAMSARYGSDNTYNQSEDLLLFDNGKSKDVNFENYKTDELNQFLERYYDKGSKKFNFHGDEKESSVFGIRRKGKINPYGNKLLQNVKIVTPGSEMRLTEQLGDIKSLIPHLATVLGVSEDDLKGVQGLIEAKEYSSKNMVTLASGLIQDIFAGWGDRDKTKADDFSKKIKKYLPEQIKDLWEKTFTYNEEKKGFVQTTDKDIQKEFKKYTPVILQAMGYAELERKNSRGVEAKPGEEEPKFLKDLLTPADEGVTSYNKDEYTFTEALEKQGNLYSRILNGEEIGYNLAPHPLALILNQHAQSAYGAAGSKNGYPVNYGEREFSSIAAQLAQVSRSGKRTAEIAQYYEDLSHKTLMSEDEYEGLANYQRNAEKRTWDFAQKSNSLEALEKSNTAIIDLKDYEKSNFVDLESLRDEETQWFDLEEVQSNTLLGQAKKKQQEIWDRLEESDKKRLVAQAGGEETIQREAKNRFKADIDDRKKRLQGKKDKLTQQLTDLNKKKLQKTAAGQTKEEISKQIKSLEDQANVTEFEKLLDEDKESYIEEARRDLGSSYIPFVLKDGEQVFASYDPALKTPLLSNAFFSPYIGASISTNSLGKKVINLGSSATAVENWAQGIIGVNRGDIEYDSDAEFAQAFGQKARNIQYNAEEDITLKGRSSFDQSRTVPIAHSMMPSAFSVETSEALENVLGAGVLKNALVISDTDFNELLKPTKDEKDLINEGRLNWTEWLKDRYIDILGDTSDETFTQMKVETKKFLKKSKKEKWKSLGEKEQAVEKSFQGRLTAKIREAATIGSKTFNQRGLTALLSRSPLIMGRDDVRFSKVFVNPDWKGKSGLVGGDPTLISLINGDFDGDHYVLSLIGADGRIISAGTENGGKASSKKVLEQAREALVVSSRENAISEYLTKTNTKSGTGVSIKGENVTPADEAYKEYQAKTGKQKIGVFSNLRQSFQQMFNNANVPTSTGTTVNDYIRRIGGETWTSFLGIPEQKTISAKKLKNANGDVTYDNIDWDNLNKIDEFYKLLSNPQTLNSEGGFNAVIRSMQALGWIGKEEEGEKESLFDLTDQTMRRLAYAPIASIVESYMGVKDDKDQTKVGNLSEAVKRLYGENVDLEKLSGLKFKTNEKTGEFESVDEGASSEESLNLLKSLVQKPEVIRNVYRELNAEAKTGFFNTKGLNFNAGLGSVIGQKNLLLAGLKKGDYLYNVRKGKKGKAKQYTEEEQQQILTSGLTLNEEKNGILVTDDLYDQIVQDAKQKASFIQDQAGTPGLIGQAYFNAQGQRDILLKHAPEVGDITGSKGMQSATRISKSLFPFIPKRMTPSYEEAFNADIKDIIENPENFKNLFLKYDNQTMRDMFKSFQAIEGGNLGHTVAQNVLEAAQQGLYTVEDLQANRSMEGYEKFVNQIKTRGKTDKDFARMFNKLNSLERTKENPEGDIGSQKQLEYFKKAGEILNPDALGSVTPNGIVGTGMALAQAYTNYLGITGDKEAQQRQLGPQELGFFSYIQTGEGEGKLKPVYSRFDQIAYKIDKEQRDANRTQEQIKGWNSTAAAYNLFSNKERIKGKPFNAEEIKSRAQERINKKGYKDEEEKTALQNLITEIGEPKYTATTVQTSITDFKTALNNNGELTPQNLMQGFVMYNAARGLQEVLKQTPELEQFFNEVRGLQAKSFNRDDSLYAKALEEENSNVNKYLKEGIANLLTVEYGGKMKEGSSPSWLQSIINANEGGDKIELGNKIQNFLQKIAVGAPSGSVDISFLKGSGKNLGKGVDTFRLNPTAIPSLYGVFGKAVTVGEELTEFEKTAIRGAYTPVANPELKTAYAGNEDYNKVLRDLSILTRQSKITSKFDRQIEEAESRGDFVLSNNIRAAQKKYWEDLRQNTIPEELKKDLEGSGFTEEEIKAGINFETFKKDWEKATSSDQEGGTGAIAENDLIETLGLKNFTGTEEERFAEIKRLIDAQGERAFGKSRSNAEKWLKTKASLEKEKDRLKSLKIKRSRITDNESEEAKHLDADITDLGGEGINGSVIGYLSSLLEFYEKGMETEKRDEDNQIEYDDQKQAKMVQNALLKKAKLDYEYQSKKEKKVTQGEKISEYQKLSQQKVGLENEKAILTSELKNPNLSKSEKTDISLRIKEIDSLINEYITDRLDDIKTELTTTIKDENGKDKQVIDENIVAIDEQTTSLEDFSKRIRPYQQKQEDYERTRGYYQEASNVYNNSTQAEFAFWKNQQQLKSTIDPTTRKILEIDQERLRIELEIAKNEEAVAELKNQEQGSPESQKIYAQQKDASAQALIAMQKGYLNSAPKQKGLIGGADSKIGGALSYMVSGYGIYRLIGKVTQAISQLANEAKNLDKTLTNLRVVTGDTKDSTRNLIGEYSNLAAQLGVTTQEVATSATEWLRQGYSVSESMDLVKSSMYLSTLGMIDSATATKSLTSALHGFQLQASESMDVVDKLTALDLEAATSAGDIAEGLAQFANLGSLAGVNIDEAASYVATISDVTQMSGSSAGQALKTIISRYGNVKAGAYKKLNTNSETTEDTTAINDVESVLKNLGISIRSSNAEFRDFDDVLGEIAEKWDTLDNVSQKAIATSFAGVRQQEAFTSLLQNWDKYEDLLETSENSEGTAETKYQSYKESLEAAGNELKASLESFVNSSEISEILLNLTNFLKKIVDTLPDLVKILPQIFFQLQNVRALSGNSLIQKGMNALNANGAFDGFKKGGNAWRGINRLIGGEAKEGSFVYNWMNRQRKTPISTSTSTPASTPTSESSLDKLEGSYLEDRGDEAGNLLYDQEVENPLKLSDPGEWKESQLPQPKQIPFMRDPRETHLRRNGHYYTERPTPTITPEQKAEWEEYQNLRKDMGWPSQTEMYEMNKGIKAPQTKEWKEYRGQLTRKKIYDENKKAYEQQEQDEKYYKEFQEKNKEEYLKKIREEKLKKEEENNNNKKNKKNKKNKEKEETEEKKKDKKKKKENEEQKKQEEERLKLEKQQTELAKKRAELDQKSNEETMRLKEQGRLTEEQINQLKDEQLTAEEKVNIIKDQGLTNEEMIHALRAGGLSDEEIVKTLKKQGLLSEEQIEQYRQKGKIIEQSVTTTNKNGGGLIGSSAVGTGISIGVNSLMSAVSAYMSGGTTHTYHDAEGEETTVNSSDEAKRVGKNTLLAWSWIPLVGSTIGDIIANKKMQKIDAERDNIELLTEKAEKVVSVLESIDSDVENLVSSVDSLDTSDLDARSEAVQSLKDLLYTTDNEDTKNILEKYLREFTGDASATLGTVLNDVENLDSETSSAAIRALAYAQSMAEADENQKAKASENYKQSAITGDEWINYNKTREGYNDEYGITNDAVAAAHFDSHETTGALAATTGALVTAASYTSPLASTGVGAIVPAILWGLAGASGIITAIESGLETKENLVAAQEEEKDKWESLSLSQQLNLLTEEENSLIGENGEKLDELDETGKSQYEALVELKTSLQAYSDYWQNEVDEYNEEVLTAALEKAQIGSDYLKTLSIVQGKSAGGEAIYEALAASAENQEKTLEGISTHIYKNKKGEILTEDEVTKATKRVADTLATKLNVTAEEILKDETGKYTEQITELLESDEGITKELSSRFKELAKKVLKTDEELSAIITGEVYTVKGAGQTLDSSNWFDEEILENFATIFGTTVEQFLDPNSVYQQKYGELTFAELSKSTADLIEEQEEYNSLLEDIADSTKSVTEWTNKIISQYPELIAYADDTGALVEKVMDKLEDLSQYELQTQWKSIANSEEAYSSEDESREDTFVKQMLNKSSNKVQLQEYLDKSKATTLQGLIDYMNGLDSSGKEYKLLEEALANAGADYTLTSDEYKDALSNYIDYNSTLLENQINNLTKQKETLSEITTQREYENKLIEAKLKLEDALNDKKRVYRAGVGFVYEADQGAIKEAQENLEEVQLEKDVSAIEKQISLLQEEKDSWDNIWDQKTFELQEEQAKIFGDKYLKLTDQLDSSFNSLTAEEMKNAGQTGTALGNINSALTDSRTGLTAATTYLEGIKENFAEITQQMLNQNTNAKTNSISKLQKAWESFQETKNAKNSVTQMAINPAGSTAYNEALSAYQTAYEEAESAGYISSDNIGEYTDAQGNKQDWTGDKKEEARDALTEAIYDADAISNLSKSSKYSGMTFYIDPTNVPVGRNYIGFGLADRYTFTLSNNPYSGSDGEGLSDTEEKWIFDKGKVLRLMNLNKENESLGDIKSEVKSSWNRSDLTTVPAGVYFSYGGVSNYYFVIDENGNFYKPSVSPMHHLFADIYYDDKDANGNKTGDSFYYESTDGKGDFTGKSKYKAGTTDISTPDVSLINEVGTEAIVTPSGTITALPAHTGVVPADITKNLWSLGEVAPNILRAMDTINPNNGIDKISSNNNSSIDESFNISNLTMNVTADDTFDADAFVEAIKARVALTRNTRR